MYRAIDAIIACSDSKRDQSLFNITRATGLLLCDKRRRNNSSSPIVAAFPLITVLLAFLFLGESMSVQKLVGAGLIVARVIVIQR